MTRVKDTFLNKEGLEYYHSKLKQEFSSKDELDKKQDILTEENAGAGVTITTDEGGKVIITSSSSSVNWGDILGDINDQTDLINIIPTQTSQLINDENFVKSRRNSTEYWNNARGFVPAVGELIIYTDYQILQVSESGTIVNKYIPGIKIGDGNAYVQDLPFVDQDTRDNLFEHINNSTTHITQQERTKWSNKLNIDDSYELIHNELENEILVFTRD